MVANSSVIIDPFDERIRLLVPVGETRRRSLPGPRGAVHRVHAWLIEPSLKHTDIGRCVCGRDDRCRPF